MAEYIFEINDALLDEKTGKAVMKPEVKGELIRCRNCKYYMPYEWMFDDISPRSSDINDYSPDEIGCTRIDIHFKSDGFCCLAGRREE